MYICTYICILNAYIHTCACIYAYMYKCLPSCIHRYTKFILICIYTLMYVYLYTYQNVYIHIACIHTCTYMNTDACLKCDICK